MKPDKQRLQNIETLRKINIHASLWKADMKQRLQSFWIKQNKSECIPKDKPTSFMDSQCPSNEDVYLSNIQ